MISFSCVQTQMTLLAVLEICPLIPPVQEKKLHEKLIVDIPYLFAKHFSEVDSLLHHPIQSLLYLL